MSDQIPLASANQTINDAIASKVFKRDQAGNYIIPGADLGGTQDVRVKYLPRGPIITDCVAVIMAVNGISRHSAKAAWDGLTEKTKRDIQKDLLEDQGMVIF